MYVMVNPINMDKSAPTSHQSNGVASGPLSSMVTPEADDFSFVVIAGTDTVSGGWNSSMASFNVATMNAPSMQNTNNSMIPDARSADDLQKKLEDVLNENKGLKDTLQQNNLAMKQQFDTLVTWQEDVVKVQHHHKEEFEKTRTLITKLKTENATLQAKILKQPDVSKINAENEELKKKVENLEIKVRQQECLSQDNTDLQAQINQLEQRLMSSTTASEAQQKAERRVCELSEEKQQVMKMNDELTQRIALLQTELQANSFVVVDDESIGGQKQMAEANPEQPIQNRVGVASSSDGLKLFCQALDAYDEKLMTSYQCLDQQMESFSHLFAWLQNMNENLPSTPDMATMKNVLVDMSVKMRELQGNIRTHRIKLDESKNQLGRLGSGLQELLEEWMQYKKQHKDIQQNNESYQEVQTQGFMEQIDRLTAQLLDAQEKLEHKTPHVIEQTRVVTENDHKSLEQIQNLQKSVEDKIKSLKLAQDKLEKSEAIVVKQAKLINDQETEMAEQNKLISEQKALMGKQSSVDQSKELRENIDSLTAQKIILEEKLKQKDEKLVHQATTLADRDSTLAHLNVKMSQQDARLGQKETEVKQLEKKLVGLEQKIDALSAQAEVYKMDFNEERESRQKIAADKERVADDLRALQRRNQQLLEQYEECQRQLVQAQQSTPTPSGARPSGFNTIATPGRVRNQWPPESTDQQVEQEPAHHQYECFKCQMRFTSYQPLVNHVEVCLEMDMFP